MVIVLSTVFSSVISPYDPLSQEFDILQPPSSAHVLGTDDLGRDLFTRILIGARVSLFVGVVAVAISMILGVAMGILSGYYGGWIDTLFMRYIDLQWAFPNFIIAVYLVAVFGTGWRMSSWRLCWHFWTTSRASRGGWCCPSARRSMCWRRGHWARLTCASCCSTSCPTPSRPSSCRRRSACPSPSWRKRRFPSWLGRQAVDADLGWIISDARSFFSRAWWLGIYPGLAIMITVLSINFLGDALRDALDVRGE